MMMMTMMTTTMMMIMMRMRMMKRSHILSCCGTPQKNFGILSEIDFPQNCFATIIMMMLMVTMLMMTTTATTTVMIIIIIIYDNSSNLNRCECLLSIIQISQVPQPTYSWKSVVEPDYIQIHEYIRD